MEEDFLTGSLREVIGPENYPGDFVPSANWPMTAPGEWGVINAGAPKYMLGDLEDMEKAAVKLPILWLRGDSDMIVSDNSMFDLGALGKLGYVPGWPGDEIYPPQPMVAQTRYVLNRYAAAGGSFEEVVIADAAHSPHIEKPEVVNPAFHAFLTEIFLVNSLRWNGGRLCPPFHPGDGSETLPRPAAAAGINLEDLWRKAN